MLEITAGFSGLKQESVLLNQNPLFIPSGRALASDSILHRYKENIYPHDIYEYIPAYKAGEYTTYPYR